MLLGIAYTLNYAAAFVLMQLAGFTLASRQPSMTAAALAVALARRDAADAQVELVAGITRSQVVATLGNILLAIPIGFLIGEFGLWASGDPLISLDKASAAVHGINPYRTLVVPFAALTGVFLWMSSLASGWAENGSAARRLPEAIARHRGLHKALGPGRALRLAEFTERHLGGITGYLVLAFLMGFMYWSSPSWGSRSTRPTSVSTPVPLRSVSGPSTPWARSNRTATSPGVLSASR
jgi:site-specific recombinase